MVKARQRFQWVWHGWRSWGCHGGLIPRDSWARIVFRWVVRLGPVELRRLETKDVKEVAIDVCKNKDAKR